MLLHLFVLLSWDLKIPERIIIKLYQLKIVHMWEAISLRADN